MSNQNRSHATLESANCDGFFASESMANSQATWIFRSDFYGLSLGLPVAVRVPFRRLTINQRQKTPLVWEIEEIVRPHYVVEILHHCREILSAAAAAAEILRPPSSLC
ncbi:hypothetical protein TIFTF001_010944 [Ficus carica]|uniref:Uncharacterized protein n=1 Tax=Ficus carica TaxID=3494 RepID=A0AA87ZZ06_FICCA|nr:hypothetical protein TIFTF001_010944 [Ficus carica]